jgi:hypothetical protein
MNLTKCIFCNKSDNLNTQMNITIDDQQIAVSICDEHAEEATVKTVKQAYLEKKSKIEEFLAQAQLLGIDISTNKSGLVLVESPKPSIALEPKQTTPVVDQAIRDVSTLLDLKDPSVVPTSKIKDRDFTSKGVTLGGEKVESYSRMNVTELEDQLPDEALQGYVKMELTEGRQGQPLAIPSLRVDKTGVTSITINKTITDEQLRRRTRLDGGYDQYDELPRCSLCRGSGTLKNKGLLQTCNKCKGSGYISTS